MIIAALLSYVNPYSKLLNLSVVLGTPVHSSITNYHKFSDLKENTCWNSCCGSAVMNLAAIHEDLGLVPGLAQWDKDLALPSALVWVAECGSDLALLWLWPGPPAIAPIQPLAWELTYVMGGALKRPKKKKEKERKKENTCCSQESRHRLAGSHGITIKGLARLCSYLKPQVERNLLPGSPTLLAELVFW